VGLNVAVELRARTGRGGSADTTSGSSRDFTVRSIAATSARGAKESMGARKTRTASLLHILHRDVAAAIPIGRLMSKSPCSAHRYA